jgi:hypothetical protein
MSGSPQGSHFCAFSSNTGFTGERYQEAVRQAMKVPNLCGWADLKSKKKERRRKSGRPSSVSLSEEGSLVSCIACYARNRSTFFMGDTIEGKANKRIMHTILPCIPVANGHSNSGPRLSQPCSVSPFFGRRGTRPGAGQGKQVSHSPHARHRTGLVNAWPGQTYATGYLSVQQRKPAKVMTHRGISRTDRIYGA